MKFRLLSIDAYPSAGGWHWNDSHTLNPCIEFEQTELTPRKIARRLREMDYLSEASKGKIHFDFIYQEPLLIEILLNNDNQPIFALQKVEEE